MIASGIVCPSVDVYMLHVFYNSQDVIYIIIASGIICPSVDVYMSYEFDNSSDVIYIILSTHHTSRMSQTYIDRDDAAYQI